MALLTSVQHQKKIVVNEVPIPEPEESQFLVKMISASLCHSDLMAMAAEGPPGQNVAKPVTIGHEGVGRIERIHPSAEGKGFKVGDVIGFLYIIRSCFECEGCMVHNLHCKTGKQLLQGFTADGFFSEYALADYHNSIILPEGLNPKTAAPIFCAGITGKGHVFYSWEKAN